MRVKFGEISVAVIAVVIVLIIILPIPSGILDVLLALNIALAIVILLNVVYSKEALQLSVFPSVLLFTTLYRLALNIKSTTLILADGEAGQVIDGFGNFVARGNLVVGGIIFLIITIVQFLVITKGTERVSEVAARFTLDAMPGKQMAIDADLNAGLINEMEAKERRRKIQRESDFYGAMDGATKFVKGDAIAGLIITVINIIGGVIIGAVMRNEDISFALQNYTILTIGDGLVSQIPSLIISVATGLIVTKSTSDEGLSVDLKKQILYNSNVFFVAAGFCILLAIPLATLPFLTLAAVFVVTGIILIRKNVENEKQEGSRLRKMKLRRSESLKML